MLKSFIFAAAATVLTFGLAGCDRSPVPQAAASPNQQGQQGQQPQRPSQEGRASYYGSEFNGRKMANGERFNPNSNSAAHRHLPLGTTAKVTGVPSSPVRRPRSAGG